MRPRTRFGLAALIVLLLLAGAYSAAWLVLARRFEAGFVRWAQSAQAGKLGISWKKIGVGGFPTALRIELADARLRDRSLDPPFELHVPALSAAASPWNFRDWRLAADRGAAAALPGAGGRPAVAVKAATAAGTLSVGRTGGATLWLRLREASAENGARLAAHAADLWLILPAQPPSADTDPLFSAAFDLQGVTLPQNVRQFGDTIDELDFAATVKGPFRGGPLRQAAAAWRDAGGTIEVGRLRLQWGTLDASASGTLALDRELQPMAAFSGAVEGYDRIIGALVRSGMIPARKAGLARLALTMLAKAGPDGRPRIATSFTIQNGEMFLGPARLGKAPHIAWN